MVIFEARNYRFTMLAPHTPKQIHLPAALPSSDYKRQLPHPEQVPLELGQALHEARVRVCECYAVVKQQSDRLLSRDPAMVGQPS
jgi:hypothetical protein